MHSVTCCKFCDEKSELLLFSAFDSYIFYVYLDNEPLLCFTSYREDGGEWDNQFLYNLGAKTGKLPVDVPRAGETDSFPSTVWITNPHNHFIGNVAAGSAGPGIWFELKLRGPSANLEINQGVNPKYVSLVAFDDNTAHSNSFCAGITTY